MYSYVDKSAKGRHVGNCALKDHSRGEIGDLMYPLFEGCGLKFRTRVAAGFIQLSDDIGHRRDTKGLICKICWGQLGKYAGIANKLGNAQTGLFRNAGDNWISLRVHGGGIQWIGAAIDAKEAG